MTTSPSSPRPRNDARIYKAISESEHRLMDTLEKGLKDVKDLIQERKAETTEIEKELKDHRESDGHPLLAARVTALELIQTQRYTRPFQTWQVVTAALFVLFSFASDIIAVISLIHALTH